MRNSFVLGCLFFETHGRKIENRDGALDIIETIDDGNAMLNESQPNTTDNLSK